MGQKKIIVAPIFLLLNRACCNVGHIPEILQVYTTHTTYSWNSASLHNTHHIFLKFCKVCTTHTTYSWNFVKSAQHTGRSLLYQKACVHNTWTISNCPQQQKQQDRPFHTSCTTTKQQQQHWVLWHLLHSIGNNNNGSFHGASSLTVRRKLGGLKRRNKLLQHKEIWSSCASSNKGVLPQVWVTRTWTLDWTLQTGYPHNTGFGVLKVCLCLFFYIANSDDCTSAGWNICELLSWDVLVIICSSKHKGGRWSSKAGMWVNSIRTKDNCRERERESEREGAVLTGLGFWTGFGPSVGSGKHWNIATFHVFLIVHSNSRCSKCWES
jgi:hypothetical protein